MALTAEEAEAIAYDYARPSEAERRPNVWVGWMRETQVQGGGEVIFYAVHVVWARREGLLRRRYCPEPLIRSQLERGQDLIRGFDPHVRAGVVVPRS